MSDPRGTSSQWHMYVQHNVRTARLLLSLPSFLTRGPPPSFSPESPTPSALGTHHLTCLAFQPRMFTSRLCWPHLDQGSRGPSEVTR